MHYYFFSLHSYSSFFFFFFFNDTATTEIYTLSLHDALPISCDALEAGLAYVTEDRKGRGVFPMLGAGPNLTIVDLRVLTRSEEHTSELQSRLHLVCRLLLEKKKKRIQH